MTSCYAIFIVTVRRILLTALLTLVFMQPVHAQGSFQLGINGMAGFPKGEFKKSLQTVGGGIDFDFVYSHTYLPVGIGVSFGYMLYGYEKLREIAQMTNADFDVNVKTYNNLFLCHLLMRAQNKYGVIRPYVDGLIGFNYLFTTTEMDDPAWHDDDEIIVCNFDDIALSYGGDIGIMMQLSRNGRGVRNRKQTEMFIDFHVRYIRGHTAEYLKKGGISRVNGDLIYDVQESDTDLLSTHLGISFAF